MAKRFQPGFLALFAALLCPITHSQQPAPTQNPRSLVEAALARLDASSDSKTRFTNFKLHHGLNFNEQGQKTYEFLDLFEETWINDLPYNRLVELNGKPLTGKDLKQEKQRYDQAVARHVPLGSQERVRLQRATPAHMDSAPQKALGSGYILRELRQEQSPHGLLHVIEATTTEPTFDQCRWRYRLSISDQTPTLFEYRADVDDATGPSEMCKGAFDEISWDLVDNTPKVTHTHSHFYVLNRQKRITVDGEDTFTRYRRFSTQVTLGPATELPAEPDGTAPQ